MAAPAPAAPAPPAASAALEILPLHEVLGGRKSRQFAAIAEAVAYEIALDDDLRAPAPAPAPHHSTPPPHSIPLPLATLDDESAFTDLMLAAATPAPAPPPPTIPLLSSLSPDDLRHVIERVTIRELAPGEVVLREGEPGGSLFAIVVGSVDVTVAGPPARTLATLSDGAFFGELAILTDFPRSATVTATRPTQLLEISRALVGEIIARSPEVLRTLLRFFRERLVDRLLSAAGLFASFDREQARALAERFLFLELDPGVPVIAAGERAPGLFFLLCGAARAVRADGGGELARLGPGDVFGEMSLLAGQPARASVETVSKCWALELPRAQFQEIMVTYPQMLEYVSDLAERRRQANEAALHVDFL
jgi:CRP-like cAMP-binding protein